MSNLPQQITINQYTADGVTAIYNYNFLILSATTSVNDIEVFVTPYNTPAIPTAQLQPLNVAYTVQNIGNPDGGTITFQAGYIPASASTVTIARNMAVTIETEFAEVQNFNGQNLDNAFERTILIEQDLATLQAQRNLSYAINAVIPTGSTITTLPVLGNQQIWQAVGSAIQAVTLVEGPDTSTLRSQLASEVPGSDGTTIIGYYDPHFMVPGTLNYFLNNLPTYINDVITPTNPFRSGMMMDFAGQVAPTGWLMCDGTAYSRTTYAPLFAEITFTQSGGLTAGLKTVTGLTSTAAMFPGMQITGPDIMPGTVITSITDANDIMISQNALSTTTDVITFYPYGYGDQSTTFNVPDLRRRTTIGFGGTVVTNPQGVGNVIGQVGGEEVHSLVIAENAAHTHPITQINFTGTPAEGGGAGQLVESYFPGATGISGSGTGHNTIQPSMAIMKIIKQ